MVLLCWHPESSHVLLGRKELALRHWVALKTPQDHPLPMRILAYVPLEFYPRHLLRGV